MAALATVVFQTLDSKHDQDGQPPPALVVEVKKQDGLVRAFYGQKMEDPDTSVLCTEWSSLEAAQVYSSSSSPPLAVSLGIVMRETKAFKLGTASSSFLSGVDAGRVFEAPCTEVFTAFDAEPGFMGNCERFLAMVDGARPDGYLGGALGAVEEEEDGGKKMVGMVIGWTSKEAHLEAKGKPGAIQDNIHELRTLRRAVDLFHVGFKQL
ncbi:ABM domain-containing protein [Madurella fahalii]|uniref:ABM domain-containing protein n=1 Tax=Madurella fahalii TaxID=1157608 RepID=A0ABQ0G029_9PEZI